MPPSVSDLHPVNETLDKLSAEFCILNTDLVLFMQTKTTEVMEI